MPVLALAKMRQGAGGHVHVPKLQLQLVELCCTWDQGTASVFICYYGCKVCLKLFQDFFHPNIAGGPMNIFKMIFNYHLETDANSWALLEASPGRLAMLPAKHGSCVSSSSEGLFSCFVYTLNYDYMHM